MLREFFDGITSVAQYSLFTVDERDVTDTRASITVAFVKGDAAALGA